MSSDKHAPAINAQHFIDGKWVTGNPLLMGAWSHAIWMGSAIFDGARAFEGVTPDLDLHCQRAIRSATALGLASPMPAGQIEEILREGIAKFPKGTPLYLRPFMWSEDGFMAPDAATTRIAISVVEAALPDPKGFSACLSKWRRPSPETAPTNAKAVALYAQAGRASADAKSKGFDEGVMLDPMGHVAEFSSSNLWIAKDGAAHTPVANGTFLAGITRARVIKLLRHAGVEVFERTLTYQEVKDADEVFSTGNYGKVIPVTNIEGRHLQPGPVFQLARRLYWDFAHGK
ncbi:branched chain amino acid aminotransferase [Hypericibacter terrae]|uniref:Probable branched-chain-amino-acid aminotransferase n=1 Tax=Hypericibacter terrae TaxID=2602015 RepID=A0A5J6MNF6_9PROT|nr:branched-chain amino acid aminotransferase [Hypericibacter terrae]QEX19212.1 branched chain amino acid aminotransferase [Hypericibacter terrae]